MIYRGYTISPETDPWALKYGSKFFIGEGDSLKSFSDLDEAKDWIDEQVMMAIPPYKVQTFGPFPIGGIPQVNITKFDSISNAVMFAAKFNGELLIQILNP